MKFTPENRRKAVELARSVNFKSTIAKLMRMHPDTLDSWLLRGATDPDGNPLDAHPDVATYVQFRRDFEEARATLENGLEVRVMAAEDWKAQAFCLERAFRHWNPKTVLAGDLSNPDTKAAALNELRAMSPEIVELMIEAWCGSELGHAPAGVRQVHRALSERWGWA